MTTSPDTEKDGAPPPLSGKISPTVAELAAREGRPPEEIFAVEMAQSRLLLDALASYVRREEERRRRALEEELQYHERKAAAIRRELGLKPRR